MKRAIALFFAIVALVAIVAAQDATIKVGGGLKFDPATVTTSPGSTLTFQWVGGSHSVVQADDGTCTPSAQANAFKVAAQTTGMATFKVPTGMPKLWFFCGVPTHCQQGMKMVVMVGTGGNSTAGGSSNSTTGSGSGSSGSGSSGSGSSGSGSSSSYGSAAATFTATFGALFTALVASLLL